MVCITKYSPAKVQDNLMGQQSNLSYQLVRSEVRGEKSRKIDLVPFRIFLPPFSPPGLSVAAA